MADDERAPGREQEARFLRGARPIKPVPGLSGGDDVPAPAIQPDLLVHAAAVWQRAHRSA